jgi:hypothetical protein
MKNNLIKIIGSMVLGFLVISTITFGFAAAQSQFQPQGGGRLDGTWDVQVSVRNCQTGAALITFPAIATFMFGGTVIVSETSIAPALKTPAQGFWHPVGGNKYRFKTKAFNFDASGNFTGWIIINQEVNLNQSADEYESAGTGELYNKNGNLIFTGCSTLSAKRFA